MSQEFDDRWSLEEQGQLELPLKSSVVPVSNITGKAGTTVQVLGRNPHSLTSVLMVHNKLETLVPGALIVAMYGGRAKPPGFGNAGGGMELDELERFQKDEPGWFKYYSSLGTLAATDLAVIGCALRESKDESGFCDLEIVLDEDTKKPVILTDQHYPEGHRIVTLWGQYNSYQQRPIKETEEIDHVAWVDFSMPMTEIFKRLRQELGENVSPYWSHLRRLLIGFSKIDQYHRSREERPCLIGRVVHPSWRLVFRVGKRDDRFPPYGYQIFPEDWYHMFDIMLEKGIEDVDNDMLLSEFNGRAKTKVLVFNPFSGKYELKGREKDLNLGNKIALAKEQQEMRMERETKATLVANAEPTSEVSADSETLVDSEDYTGIRSLAEIIQAEDEEYGRWLERELGIGR